MKQAVFDVFAAPLTKQPLVQKGRFLVTADGRERYPILFHAPVLLPGSDAASWRRELVEMILWEHPDEIEELYADEERWRKDPNALYCGAIRRLVGGKEEILQAIDRYAAADTGRWLPQKSGDQTVSREAKRDYLKYSTAQTGRKRLLTAQTSPSKAAYQYYAEAVQRCAPGHVLELSTGAGTGTALAANAMADDAVLYTVDVDFSCLGNAVGIGKYLHKTVQPVCANFWALPFRDEAFDLLCTVNGLDESREIQRTLAQALRVLKPGGRFLVFSRKSAFMRQRSVLAAFGFSQEETEELLQKCRLYASAEKLIDLCQDFGLTFKESAEFAKDESTTWAISLFQKAE